MTDITIFHILLIASSAISGTMLLFFAMWEVADWLSNTKWYKKHFTTYGG